MKRGEKRKNQETEGGNLTYQMEEHRENLFLWWWHVDLTCNYTNFICHHVSLYHFLDLLVQVTNFIVADVLQGQL